ncbi:two-component system, OmpR family, phosphate regulon sensor histidine kinase PhoR [Faunimonas pinastri]|uniref:histidine kinase n=1 Tax=Faunimonas pinastri TaxID=1855383 RepID=A0A1H8ZG02_9HYPH|nr:ATP-binding protein [Faunimonas pinastri]SEP63306.1 two-component system, OmpR family, phosphate regulon sensor histidine kinase PhoR [Faunimonas pinastri]
MRGNGGMTALAGALPVLLVAALALGLACISWGLPWPYALVSFLLICLAALFSSNTAAVARLETAETHDGIWPDNSIKATVNALRQSALVLDLRGTVRYLNDRAVAEFPATRAGDPLALTFRAPRIGEVLRELAKPARVDLEIRSAGQAKVYEIAFSPLNLPGSEAGFVLVVFEDQTERLAIDRMRTDFIANASHELRTPLASLTGFIETLLGPARDDPAASDRFLRIMLEQAGRMRRLIDDLLSLSRAEMKVHRRPKDKVDVIGVLKQVGDALGPMAERLEVALEFDLPKGPVAVLGERDELLQVFENLMENGLKYGSSGKRILVSLADAAPGNCTVSVRDWGAGIAADHLPRLTERFYRVDPQASRQTRGTGLGLAIVKHILTRHEGRLTVDSAPGEGTTFHVTLPRAPDVTLMEEIEPSQELRA